MADGKPQGLGTYLNKATGSVDKGFYTEFLRILGDAKKTSNQATRAESYRRAQTVLADSAILILLWQNLAHSYVIAQKNVKGITLDATTIFRAYLLSK